MSYHPTDDQQFAIEWHMQQLRRWMIPNPMPTPPPAITTSQSADAVPRHFCTQNVPSIDFYNYDTATMTVATQMPPQRAQTFSDLSDFDYDYAPAGYFQSPMTPSSCPPDDLGVFDDVDSCFSEAPSSFTDKSIYDNPNSLPPPPRSTTSQPSPALLQPPPSEVDALMKSIIPPPCTTGTSPTSSTSASSNTFKVKRHFCPYHDCAKAFSQPTHLKIHLRSHTGEKPYTCSVPTCRQAFSQLGNLRTHERRHIGQRPNRKQRSSSDPGFRTRRYECILDGCRSGVHSPGSSATACASGTGGKVFTQLGNLKAHMNKFHKDTLARLQLQFAHTAPTEDDRELREYFAELYKNSNKGIKGRGKGRKVQVVVGDDGC